MLAVLKIKNLALVEDITWELGPGLIGVTGQTGAGKSMIVGALKLILGERASRDLIRRGESTCRVEAIFKLSTNLPAVNQLLEECGLDPCEGDSLLIKRSFGSGNTQFVNCCPCTLAVLKRLGGLLIDLHGPHEHQSLISRERQLAMLDSYAGCEPELGSYVKAYRDWDNAKRDLEEFKEEGFVSDQEIELLRYQLEEITNAALIEEELEALERRYSQARNAARLISSANESIDSLGNAIAAMTKARKYLKDLESLDPETKEVIGSFDSARLEIEEVEQCLREYTGNLEIDPAEMVEMENRIDQVESLKRKYGQTIRDVLSYEAAVRTKLGKVDHRDEETARLESLLSKASEKLTRQGAVLSRKRIAKASGLESEIRAHLEGLGFTQSKFEIGFEPMDAPGTTGLEKVEFMFGPNPGEELKPLRVVASSGEMSRVMLAVKSALAVEDETPLMVFDEIDANVGGEIAGAVGEKMAALGEKHQVIAITHMPQVAAMARHHYMVKKSVVEDSTITLIDKVENDDRVEELARMLGGVGDETLALAGKMLEQ